MRCNGRSSWLLAAFVLGVCLAVTSAAAVELSVVDPDGNPVAGFRWLLEEDNTHWVDPGVPVSDSISVNIHKSYSPVVDSGQSAGSTATITPPDPNGRYYVSVLPDSGSTVGGFSQSGAPLAPGQTAVQVVVNQLSIPTAQISIWVFEDHNIINNAPDQPNESGLANFKVIIEDIAGQVIQDAWGNPLGTEYQRNLDGSFVFNGDVPVVETLGTGVLITDADGWAYAKYILPGKYGVVVSPPVQDSNGDPVTWVQTATIEGTNVIDAWVMADEPRLFVEGFGAGTAHTEFGFVNPDTLPWAVTPPGGSGTVTGRIVNNHFARPPLVQGYHVGEPVDGCWVGLNDPTAQQGLIAVECAADSTFSIAGVPPGNYQLVHWDANLDQLFGFQNITVPEDVRAVVDLGDVLSYRWFGTLQGRVFEDLDEDGFPDSGENGIANQAVIIRYRDGRIYKEGLSQPPNGDYIISEVFPFFKWLVVEVDFLTRKATGATFAVDEGGEVPPDDNWITPSRDKLTPQIQPESNPHTNNNLSRTEAGEVLTQAMQLYLGQTNVIDWGKAHYGDGENGGISGIVFQATTRAVNDPRWAGGDPWEPGIPRVQLNLYDDKTGPGLISDGVIDDYDGDSGPTRADVDNYPFGFRDGDAPGAEDVDRNANNQFDPGDAISITWTDSWDDDPPTGCIQDLPVVHGQEVPECYDNYGTWNQLRPGVFDGGFAFTSYTPNGIVSGAGEVDGLPTGVYIVEAVTPPHYTHQREEDRNVDFGDTFQPSLKDDEPRLVPPFCVGDGRVVGDYLTQFPDLMEPAPFAGDTRPLCDLKQVTLTDGSNTGVEFHMWTEVPKAARVVGFVNNDLTAEFNAESPNYGEKAAPSWIPISIQDYAGNVLNHVYADEFGSYNAMVPSNYTNNAASPSGMALQSVTHCLNFPFMPDPNNPGELIADPYYDPDYSQACWVREMLPGATTYNDTPIVPIGAYVGYPNRNLDVEAADLTPGISKVVGDLGDGPVLCGAGGDITIVSVGLQQVPNPDFNPDLVGSPALVTRDYGFGSTQGQVTLGGVSLPIVSWDDSTIVATVPVGTMTGQLKVQRGDNSAWSESGLTVHVGECSATFVPTDQPTIQAAIDAASPGDLIVVEPGLYYENPIMWKPLRLQGAGPQATEIFANATTPQERLPAWHEKITDLIGNDPFQANEAPGLMVLGNAGEPFGMGVDSLIDGFGLTGSISGGGLYVAFDVADLTISNNIMRSNQGIYGGGIGIGMPDIPTTNSNVVITSNRIVKNGGVVGAGGITVFAGSTGYQITDNVIVGNLSRWYGGGIAHWGLSDGGLIARNDIDFNEVFFGAAIGGDGGGIFIAGTAAGGDGSGTVTVDANRIRGNTAGSGHGGGIRVASANGTDVATFAEADWYEIRIFNNIIANNVAAMTGAGIALQDVADAFIINNTIVNNDSSATSANAFESGVANPSTPQIAGVASAAHSAALQAAFPGVAQEYSDPVLANNIIWHNRSYYWDPAWNSNKGGLREPATLFTDVGVVSIDPLHVLHPMSSVLTDTTGYDSSNVTGDPQLLSTVVNNVEGAAVLDEGGNNISVRFTPLTSADDAYLLDMATAETSSAFTVGDPSWVCVFSELASDVEQNVRTTGGIEAGANEHALLIGDSNCNGVVDFNDLLQIFFVLRGTIPSVCRNEDVTGDCTVNVADFIAWRGL